MAPGCCCCCCEEEGVRPRTSSTLERDAPAMLCMRLCARARWLPSARETLDNETCESCRELAPLPVPVPVPEPELVCRERERGRKATLMRASEAPLPLREREPPRRDTRGLDWDEDGERRPTESSRSRASRDPSGDGWSERDARSSSSWSEPESMLSERRSSSCCCCCSSNWWGRVAARAPTGVGDIGTVPARWRPLAPAAGWRGGMGIPLMGSGLYADELAAPTETGELAGGEEEDAFVVVSTLPVLRDARDARVDVLLLCGVALVREKAKGGEPVDEMLPPRPGWRNAKG